MAINVLSKISKSEMEQLAYLSRLKYINDERHNLTVTRKQGLEQGIKKARRKTILNGLKLNLPLETIAQLTDLPISEIKRIAKQE